MTQVHSKYPHGMSDEDIERLIQQYSDAITDSKANINAVMQFSPLIQLGQNELQGRQTKKVTRLSIIVSITSLIIAGSALYVSYNSTTSSAKWENNQLRLLSYLREEAKNMTDKLQLAIHEN